MKQFSYKLDKILENVWLRTQVFKGMGTAVSPEDMKRTGTSYNMATQKYMTLNSCLGNSTNTIAGLKIALL